MVSQTGNSYLDLLPANARYLGDSEAGEIEILHNALEIADAANARVQRLRSESFLTQDYETGVIFEDEYILIVRDPVRFPSGVLGTYLRIFLRSALSGSNGAVIVPVSNGRVFFRRVFRHATRRWELELPRGFREANQAILETVHRELAEEIGYRAKSITYLGELCGDSGLIAGVAEAFIVELGEEAENSAPEKMEAFGELSSYGPEELKEVLASGEIRDCFTLSAVLLAMMKGYLNIAT